MAKMEKYGGNPKCIIAEPEIFTVNIDEELDFVLIGSDGIFDRISTEDTVQIVIDEARMQTETMKVTSRHNQGSFEHVARSCGSAVDKVMTAAMEKESMDNLSVVILSFPNFTRFLESIELQQGIGSQQRNRSQLTISNDPVAPIQLKTTMSPSDQIHSS